MQLYDSTFGSTLAFNMSNLFLMLSQNRRRKIQDTLSGSVETLILFSVGNGVSALVPFKGDHLYRTRFSGLKVYAGKSRLQHLLKILICTGIFYMKLSLYNTTYLTTVIDIFVLKVRKTKLMQLPMSIKSFCNIILAINQDLLITDINL